MVSLPRRLVRRRCWFVLCSLLYVVSSRPVSGFAAKVPHRDDWAHWPLFVYGKSLRYLYCTVFYFASQAGDVVFVHYLGRPFRTVLTVSGTDFSFPLDKSQCTTVAFCHLDRSIFWRFAICGYHSLCSFGISFKSRQMTKTFAKRAEYLLWRRQMSLWFVFYPCLSPQYSTFPSERVPTSSSADLLRCL